MEEMTSTSNEGRKKRDLNKYKKMETKKVSDEEMKKSLTVEQYEALKRLEAIAFDVKANVRDVLGFAGLTVSSADAYEIDIEELINSYPWKNLKDITPKNKVKIDRVRNANRKKQEEKRKMREAKENEEMHEDIELDSNFENFTQDDNNR